jgi:hypothetical protein
MRLDFLAHEAHFVDHLAAVWHALPEDARGAFVVPFELGERAMRRKVEPAHAEFTDGPILVASYGDVKRARASHRGPIAWIEHGAGQSYSGDAKAETSGSYPGGLNRGDVGLFLVPNRHSAGRFRAAYPKARVEMIGCPKLDYLPARDDSEGPTVALSFHWDCSLTPETRSAYAHFAGVLPVLAKRYKVIGHGHPRALDGPPRLRRLWQRLGVEIVEDFEDVCRRADVFVADNTSALFEFAATGRPVVVLNAPSYRRTVKHGLRFWEAADVGVQVDRPEDLVGAVGEALQDAPARRAARERALSIVYAHRSGAAQRAADVLLSWLPAVEVAA